MSQDTSNDQSLAQDLQKYYNALDKLGIYDESYESHFPSRELLGHVKNVTAQGIVGANTQLGQDHLNSAIQKHRQGNDDIAITELKISNGKIEDNHALSGTVNEKLTNPDVKSATHIVGMQGHWLALTFKQQLDENGKAIMQDGKPKITAFLADSLPETPQGSVKTSFDENRENLQKYVEDLGCDFVRVKCASQGTEQCGENAVANALAMERASFQELKTHQYNLGLSLAGQTSLLDSKVGVQPSKIREDLKQDFNSRMKVELENQISEDIVRASSQGQSTSRISDAPASGRLQPMEVGSDLLGGSQDQSLLQTSPSSSSLFDSLRAGSFDKKDFPLTGYLEKLQINLAVENSLKDPRVQDPEADRTTNAIQRMDLLEGLSTKLSAHISQYATQEDKKYAEEFIENLKKPVVANNLGKFLPIITKVVENPQLVNSREFQSRMELEIFRAETPPSKPRILSPQEQLEQSLSNSRQQLTEKFSLYENLSLNSDDNYKYKLPEVRLNLIKKELLNYLKLDQQTDQSKGASADGRLDVGVTSFIDDVFKHDPAQTTAKLPFIMQLVEDPKMVYNQKFIDEYHSTVINPQQKAGSEVSPWLMGKPDEIIAEAFQDLKISGRGFGYGSPEPVSRRGLEPISPWLMEVRGRASDGLQGATVSGGDFGHGSPEPVSPRGEGSGQFPRAQSIRGDSQVDGLEGAVTHQGAEDGGSMSRNSSLRQSVDHIAKDLSKDKSTPSPSPRPVGCFNFKEMLRGVADRIGKAMQSSGRAIFGGVRSDGQDRGSGRGQQTPRASARFFGRSRAGGAQR